MDVSLDKLTRICIVPFWRNSLPNGYGLAASASFLSWMHSAQQGDPSDLGLPQAHLSAATGVEPLVGKKTVTLCDPQLPQVSLFSGIGTPIRVQSSQNMIFPGAIYLCLSAAQLWRYRQVTGITLF